MEITKSFILNPLYSANENHQSRLYPRRDRQRNFKLSHDKRAHTYSRNCRNMGASGASIHQRVRKLEEAGVISGSYVKINEEKLGYTTHAFIGIYLDKASHNSEAVAMLNKIPEVTSCYYTTGGWSLLIKLTCKDNNHLSALLSDKIQKIPGISRTETYICLKHQIERQIKF